MTVQAKKFDIWDGVYPTMADAAQVATGLGFSGDTYRTRAIDATRECIDALANGRPIPAFHKQRSTVLPAVAAMQLSSSPSLRVLDFGGGLGIGYLTLAESLGSAVKSVDYTIVEVPAVCDTGRGLFPNGEIGFADTLPDGTFDLVHSASALQYIDDWEGILTLLCSYQASHILLSDVFAGAQPTFATLQTYYESRIPHWFLNLDDMVCVLSAAGYRLIMKNFVSSRRLGAEDVLPMDNFPPDRRLNQTLHLLLQRVV